jgi:hypothetical protein
MSFDGYTMLAVYAPVNVTGSYIALEFHGLYHTQLDADHTIARYPSAFAVKHLFDASLGYHVYCSQKQRENSYNNQDLLYFTNDINEVTRISQRMYPGCILGLPTPVRTGYDEMAPEEVALRDKDKLIKKNAAIPTPKPPPTPVITPENIKKVHAHAAARYSLPNYTAASIAPRAEIIIILDYNSTSHAFFGDTEVIKEELLVVVLPLALLQYNRDNTYSARSSNIPLFSYNTNLKLNGKTTPGWLIRDKDRLGEAKALFDEIGVTYTEKSAYVAPLPDYAAAWKKPRSTSDTLRTLPRKELVNVFLTGQLPETMY